MPFGLKRRPANVDDGSDGAVKLPLFEGTPKAVDTNITVRRNGLVLSDTASQSGYAKTGGAASSDSS